MYAKGPVVTAHTYPYQPNGNGFKGAIPRVTLLALQTTTPDRNADRLPMPCVLRKLTQLHVVRGPCSFDDLKTVEACMSSGAVFDRRPENRSALHVVRGPSSFDDLKTVEACTSSGGRFRSKT